MQSTELIDESFFAEESSEKDKGSKNIEKSDLPYARNVLITGATSIVAVLSIFGFMLGLYLLNTCLKRSKESLKSYKDFPGNYTESSLKRVRTGRTLGLIALSIWILEILLFVTVY